MFARMRMKSPHDTFDVRTLEVADSVPSTTEIKEGDCVTLDAAGKAILVGGTPPSHFGYIVKEGTLESPSGIWTVRKIAVYQPLGTCHIETTVYNPAQTYAVGSELTMKDGVWDLAGTDPVHGVVFEKNADDESPLEIKWTAI